MISSINASCNNERPSNEVLCEQMFRSYFGIACYVGADTEIRSQSYKIISTDHQRIQSLDIRKTIRNDGVIVRYLPVVNRFISNIIEYVVNNAAISVIGKENFDGMIWLEDLKLSFNFIQTIPKDTFRGLIRLKYIDLGRHSEAKHKINLKKKVGLTSL